MPGCGVIGAHVTTMKTLLLVLTGSLTAGFAAPPPAQLPVFGSGHIGVPTLSLREAIASGALAEKGTSPETTTPPRPPPLFRRTTLNDGDHPPFHETTACRSYALAMASIIG